MSFISTAEKQRRISRPTVRGEAKQLTSMVAIDEVKDFAELLLLLLRQIHGGGHCSGGTSGGAWA